MVDFARHGPLSCRASVFYVEGVAVGWKGLSTRKKDDTMKFQVGVGLASAALLCLAALSAAASNSDGSGGNAWGTNLAEMKSTASLSVGNGNGHAWGLMLADIKGKGGED